MSATRDESAEIPTSQSDALLRALFPEIGDGFLELRLIPKSGRIRQSYHRSVEELVHAASQHIAPEEKMGVYFGVCLRAERNGAKSAIKRVSCLWVDLDAKDFAGGKTEALNILRQFPIPPTAIVDSGHGYHAYWRLKEPEMINSPKNTTRIEAHLKGLADELGGDTASAELARVMRLPGSVNWKDALQPVPVSVIELNPTLEYNLRDFDECRAIPADAPKRIGNGPGWITQAFRNMHEGNRNQTFTRITGKLHRERWAPQDIIELLTPHAERTGYPAAELSKQVHRLAKRYRNGNRVDATARVPVVVRLADVQPESVLWLWPRYVPKGKLTLLEGDPGVGKTTVALNIAAMVTRGDPFPDVGGGGGECREPGTVVYLSAEDGIADTLRPRLDAANADVTRVYALTGISVQESDGTSSMHAVTLKDIAILDEVLEKYKPELLVVDPLQAYLGAGVDMHRANETRPVLAALAALAEKHKCAVLCIRHLGKSSQDRAVYRGLGSIDFAAAARSIILAAQNPNDPDNRVLAHVKYSLSPQGQSCGYQLRDGQFYWTGAQEISADELLRTPIGSDERSALDEAADYLEEALENGPTPSNDIKREARRLKISTASLRRAKDRLKLEVSCERNIRGRNEWFWSLPDQSMPLSTESDEQVEQHRQHQETQEDEPTQVGCSDEQHALDPSLEVAQVSNMVEQG